MFDIITWPFGDFLLYVIINWENILSNLLLHEQLCIAHHADDLTIGDLDKYFAQA